MSETDSCKELMRQAAQAFRLGMEGFGGDALKRFIDCLTGQLSEVGSGVTKKDMELLQKIIAAQERKDLILLADLLEYDVPVSSFGRLIVASQ